MTRQLTCGGDGSCDGGRSERRAAGVTRMEQTRRGPHSWPRCPSSLPRGWLCSQPTAVTAMAWEARGHLQGDMGERPRLGRASATTPRVLESPKTDTSVPSHTALGRLTMRIHDASAVHLVFITDGETEAQGGSGSCLRSHGACLDSVPGVRGPVPRPSAQGCKQSNAYAPGGVARGPTVCPAPFHTCVDAEHLLCAPRGAGVPSVPSHEAPTVCLLQLGCGGEEILAPTAV